VSSIKFHKNKEVTWSSAATLSLTLAAKIIAFDTASAAATDSLSVAV
jgi:hypothetical protein